MFSGIINYIFKIRKIKKYKNKKEYRIKLKINKKIKKKCKRGDSICLNGICTTILSIKKNNLFINISKETLKYVVNFKINNYINFENSLKIKNYINGHIIYGHINTIGKIINIKKNKKSHIIIFKISKYFNKIKKKNSISINGISLTINNIEFSNKYIFFTINIINFTFKNTNLKFLKLLDKVNIEFDILINNLNNIIINEKKRRNIKN
ncbi:putative riboflavin synthase, alpha subunit [Candidatus Zinderia insecticola CARI]|uniref:Riboflavin synthase n=1 Tax=Zinderia insecticola (strain CARI) TaxID=871271 RepID=E0TIL4_ZINIC|nr:putative riboflavin synthase, alpha subunit [Candidatus Zinderia insecticola CARI]